MKVGRTGCDVRAWVTHGAVTRRYHIRDDTVERAGDRMMNLLQQYLPWTMCEVRFVWKGTVTVAVWARVRPTAVR